MRIERSIDGLRRQVAAWRAAGETVGYVPTMGALHAGHMALVRAARGAHDRVLVSIFVNPLQFGEGEDFERYPRCEREDLALCAEEGADLVWLPEAEQLFPGLGRPGGFNTTVEVPALSSRLCGRRRPTHFRGVATEMAKVLMIVRADEVLLGEKDYQQLVLLATVVGDLSIPTAVRGVPTVRESDGLAVSSRNAYLSEHERAIAPALFEVLTSTACELEATEMSVASALASATAALERLGFSEVEYLELVDPLTLRSVAELNGDARLLVAAWLGSTRLIDNVCVQGRQGARDSQAVARAPYLSGLP